MKTETIKNGWVTFHRHHCKEGFIDRWMGDANDHPDNKEKSLLQLNSVVIYYRLNGNDKWVESYDLPGILRKLVKADELTSDEIWDFCFMNY